MLKNDLTFFQRESKKHELKDGDITRRKVILALMRENKPLSIFKLHELTGIDKKSVRTIIELAIQRGFVHPIAIVTHKSIQPKHYDLTNDGIELGLALHYESKEQTGIDHRSALTRILEVHPSDRPLGVLLKYTFQQAIARGMTDFVLRWIAKINEIKEIHGSTSHWQEATNWIKEAIEGKERILMNCFYDGFNALRDDERLEINAQLRHRMISALYGAYHKTHQKIYIQLAAESDRDPSAVYLPVTCACQTSRNMRFTIMNILEHTFAYKKFQCEKCKSFIEWTLGEEEPIQVLA